jgi:prolycopene isomerase
VGDNFLVSFPSFYDPRLAPKDGESVCILASVPFVNKKFWKENTEKITETIIDKVDRIVPGLRSNISFREVATPLTYYKFTFNRDGAACGWAPTPMQVANPIFRHHTPIERLFLTGHWTLIGFGVSRVALSGYNTSTLIMASYKNKD